MVASSETVVGSIDTVPRRELSLPLPGVVVQLTPVPETTTCGLVPKPAPLITTTWLIQPASHVGGSTDVINGAGSPTEKLKTLLVPYAVVTETPYVPGDAC